MGFNMTNRNRTFTQITWLLIALAAIGTGCRGHASQKAADSKTSTTTTMPILELPQKRLKAPEFPKDFEWVNTDRPLFIREQLKGSVILLDFWTYCCINCMHILPDLAYLEHKYQNEPFVVIGVHSAKFENEGDADNIETACARYNIAHPVLVDQDHRIWSEYGVRAWPTLVVIDPEGRVVGTVSGEGHRETLDAVVFTLLKEGRERKTLAVSAPVFQRKGRVPAASGLAFPGKVLAEPTGKFVFISDSNHDRIIIADADGRVISIAGSGVKGNSDGSFSEARFNNPQGLAYDEKTNMLYAADTENHLIRVLDLANKRVETICGTGEQVWDRTGGGIGRAQSLNSPWDLALVDSILYIAMAGNHQIWILDLKTRSVRAWSGSGMEDIVDGTSSRAALAQPSGLAVRNGWLYFADSEVSAVRKASLETGDVQTLVGTGLFDFGDRDGSFDNALFQHPLGVAVWREEILVADTYNHKIKRLNENSRSAKTSVASDEPLRLYEPGGISVRGDTLYIADTNNDRIIEYDLLRNVWREFVLTGLHSESARMSNDENIPVLEFGVRMGDDLHWSFAPEFPVGIHVNQEAPVFYSIQRLDGSPLTIENRATSIPQDVVMPASDGAYLVSLSFAYCTDGNRSLCVPVTLRWRVNLLSDSQSDNRIRLSAAVRSI